MLVLIIQMCDHDFPSLGPKELTRRNDDYIRTGRGDNLRYQES